MIMEEGIAQDEFQVKLPPAFHRTVSNGKLKKRNRGPGAPGGSLCEPRPSALETYGPSSGNGDGLAPGGFQDSPPRKLKKRYTARF